MIVARQGWVPAVLRGLYVALAAAIVLSVLNSQLYAQSMMTHHMRPEVANGQAKFLNRMAGTQLLNIDLVLPLRDPAGLDAFLQDVYDSSSPNYRHFLTVPEFTEKFGPTQQDYDAVLGFAKSYGLTVTGGSRDSMDVQVRGSVTSIEAAFNVSMGYYQHPTENRPFYSPDREPMAPLPFALWHVSGLDNFSIPHAALHSTPDLTAKSNTTTGSCPSSSYCGSDLRAAYYGGSLTGTGQNLGLLEYLGTDLADLNAYFTNTHSTNNVPVTLISTDGTSTSCTYSTGCDDTEQTIDMTQAITMAPGLSNLFVFVGSTDTAILGSMSTHLPLSAQLSSSWTWGPADPSTDDPYFKKFAAQGQNYFQASGDNAKYTTRSTDVFPADDANVTTVGGTDLSTTGPGGAWSGETAWADSGGGYYTRDAIAIPSWQLLSGVITTTNQGSKTYRNAPDVAAEANFDYYVCADQKACTANVYGGTSFATPMWAAYMALTNQQALLNGNAVLGFINPLIYPMGLSSSYGTYFHDIKSGSNGYSAVAGFDLATGWGSPNGAGLLNALAGTPSAPNFSISAGTTSLTVIQGKSGTSLMTTTVSGGFSSAVTLSTPGLPTGVTSGFSVNPIVAPGSGSSLLTLTVGATVATGTYTITVTGTNSNSSITNSTTLSLTVTAPDFTIAASPASVTVQRGSSGTSGVTTTALNGFSAAIGLSASGLPTGASVGFNPTSITGAGSSTVTLSASSTTPTGTYSITLTGTSGSLVHSTSVSLTVTAPDFTIAASPASVTVQRGSSGTSGVTTTALNGFSAAIGLTASGLPTGASVGFNPTSITGAGSSTVTLSASSTTPTGTYSITLTGTSGSLVHSTSVSLTVTAPDFTIAASPASVTVPQGSSGTSKISTTALNGFSAAIGLSASGLPTGASVGFNPTSITGAGSSTVTLSASSTTPTGTYSITLTGTSGSQVHSTSVSLTVTAQNFTVSASPSTVTITKGSSSSATITTTVSGGFNSAIALSASGQPSGVTVSFSSTSIRAPGSGTSRMTIAVSRTAGTGTSAITITASGGSITHTTSVSVAVSATTGR